MFTIQQITSWLEAIAAPALQESYDNCGLITGSHNTAVTGILVTLDCTEAVVEEAIANGQNLIVAHHPIVFKGLKKLNGKNYVERTVIKAIKYDVAIFAIHTNLDHIAGGVSFKMAQMLGLTNVKVLQPKKNLLKKLTVFVPEADTDKLLEALHLAGAGNIGNYSGCSFSVLGEGRFTPAVGTNPAIGVENKPEKVVENRIEIIFPAWLENGILLAMRQNHPYEEVAYYLQTLDNEFQEAGAGVIAELPEPKDELAFLNRIKSVFRAGCLRYTAFLGKPVKRVALCGGSGSFLLADATRAKADVFITADFKYHEFFDAENRIVIADIGHFETEQFTKELLYELITKNFPNIAVRLSCTETNPVKYL